MRLFQTVLFLFALVVLSSFTTVKTPKSNKVKLRTAAVQAAPILEKIQTTAVLDSIKLTSSVVSDSLSALEEVVDVVAESTLASYYHDKFTGRRTASGTVFDNAKYTAAHKTLPFGTRVKVTNLKNKKSVILTITDRGPFTKSREIDLSKKAFMEIAQNKGQGELRVSIEKIDEDI